MNILVIGGGGREHALAWKIAQSPRVAKVFVAPGNAGTALEPGLTNVAITSIPDLVAFAQSGAGRADRGRPGGPAGRGHRRRVSRRGAADLRRRRSAAAQLESSKDYAKSFMARHGIPTAQSRTFTEPRARTRVRERARRTDRRQGGRPRGGQGRGRRVQRRGGARGDRRDAVGDLLGAAGARVVVEEFLAGEEASFIVMVDGRDVLPLASSQDHKRLRDGDTGPNTGGMGAYSPAPVVTPALHARIMREVVLPTVSGMAADGIPYSGFLYAGVMIDDQGRPRVLEFNCRLGDPETQPMMVRMKSDLVELLLHAIERHTRRRRGRMGSPSGAWGRARSARISGRAAQGRSDRRPRSRDAGRASRLQGLPRRDRDERRGLIFPPTIIAGAVGVGIAGAAVGKAGNVLMKSDVADELAGVITPGTSGIVALVSITAVDAVEATNTPDAKVVKSAPISDEDAAAVKQAAKAGGDKAAG